MAEKIKEQFKHTSARTVASNSDLGKWLKGRAAWGDAVWASPRTLSCITGSWDHHPSNNRRCKPSYFFWILPSGWKRMLEEAQGSSEISSHRANRMQNVLPKARGQMKTRWLLLITLMSHTLGVLKSCFSHALSKTITHKSWKQNPERCSPSTNTSLMVSLSTLPKNDGLSAKLSYSGLVFDTVHCKTLHPFPDLQFLVVSDCNPHLAKTSGDKKWEFNRELHTLLKISIIISTVAEKSGSIQDQDKNIMYSVIRGQKTNDKHCSYQKIVNQWQKSEHWINLIGRQNTRNL